MKAPWTTWLAASLWTITIALMMAFIMLMYANDRITDQAYSALLVFCITSSLATVGALLGIHRPDNPIGWIFIASSVSVVLSVVAEEYSIYITSTSSGALPEITLIFWLASWTYLIVFTVPSTYGILFFPTGRLPSRRWLPFAWFLGIWLALAFAVEMFSPGPLDPEPDGHFAQFMNPVGIESLTGVFDAYMGVDGVIPVTPLLFVGAIASVFVRLRVATPVERLQIKWFAYAAPIPLLGLIVEQAIYALSDSMTTGDATAGSYIAILGTAILPVTIGIAILRHNLYDIDRLINRTLVYGSLTLLLGLGFIGGVILLQIVISPFTTGNDVAIVGSTLLTATIFRPVRSRVQNLVDRRFFRAKYDAHQTLTVFSAAVRDNVDVRDLAAQIESVMNETLKPQHFSIWVSQPENRSRSARP